mgnify:CR=1 FL=1
MKVGDLVRVQHAPPGEENGIGIITHLWVGGAASVLFTVGVLIEFDEDDLEVISGGR